MSGMWKRSMAGLVRHRQTKGAETDRPDLNHRATSRLYRRQITSRRNRTLFVSPFFTMAWEHNIRTYPTARLSAKKMGQFAEDTPRAQRYCNRMNCITLAAVFLLLSTKEALG